MHILEEKVDTAKFNRFLEQDDDTIPAEVPTRKVQNPLFFSLRFAPQKVLALDHYVKTWLKNKQSYSLNVEAGLDTYRGALKSTAEYARDYGYPSFTVGLRYNFNHGTTMHRDAADWGEKLEVPYTTHLGDFLTLYGRFDRPLFRTKHWTAGYYIGTGAGYAFSHYDNTEHIDNEFIGTHLNIFFTAGIFADWQFAKEYALELGIDYSHHSNGALYRPNKGANYFGPFIGIKHQLGGFERSVASEKSECYENSEPQKPCHHAKSSKESWRKHPVFLEFTLSAGAKALNEDWQQTQFRSEPSDPDFRTDQFSVYGAFSLQTDIMYRYARRWATGLGFDVFYGDYASKVARYEGNKKDHISPWSMGIAIKHEAYYGRLTAQLGFGCYVYRHMGTLAKAVEQPYYERVGLFYTLCKKTGLAIGFSIKAHKTKADLTEIGITCPIKF